MPDPTPKKKIGGGAARAHLQARSPGRKEFHGNNSLFMGCGFCEMFLWVCLEPRAPVGHMGAFLPHETSRRSSSTVVDYLKLETQTWVGVVVRGTTVSMVNRTGVLSKREC